MADFDFTKGPFPYETKDRAGRQVKVLAYEALAIQPLVVCYFDSEGVGAIGCRYENGQHSEIIEGEFDLMPPDFEAYAIWLIGKSSNTPFVGDTAPTEDAARKLIERSYFDRPAFIQRIVFDEATAVKVW